MVIKVLKNAGEYENFNREKLRDSLLRSSASLVTTNDVIKKIESNLVEGMSTSQIYSLAFSYLNKKEKRTAMRYSVKRSVLDLGPTGFPFEKYVAKIFDSKGFKTMVGITLPGKCIEHEVDVIAYDKNELILMEVKFHNSISIKTDTKVALYVKARWDDLKGIDVKLENGLKEKPTRGILTTNTDFTQSAIDYGKCSHLEMISWNYPHRGNLFDLIRDTGQHPVTVINDLSKHHKEKLIEMGYITANQVLENPNVLLEIGMNKNRKSRILEDIKDVCEIG